MNILIDEKYLLDNFNISKDDVLSSEMSLEDLNYIADDFRDNKYIKYENIMLDFIKEYFSPENLKNAKIHSYRSRVKDPEHLVGKIIRKKNENYKKYAKLNKDNYEKFVMDLVGIRCFVLFKKDWIAFHDYLLSKFENDDSLYIRNCLEDFDDDESHNYIAEKPKAHIRNGDARDIYEEKLSPDCVVDDKVYRSVHYIIKYKGVYLEIQVRTLYEEGWGEVDHAILYPQYKNDWVLNTYTELMNRLSGLADEMASFFNVVKELEIFYLNNSPNDLIEMNKEVKIEEVSNRIVNSAHNNVKTEADTPQKQVNNIDGKKGEQDGK